MPITTGQWAKLMRPGLDRIWADSYEKYPSEWSQCFTTSTSKLGYEEDIMTMGFSPAVVKSEGGSINYGEARQLWVNRLTPKVWAKGFVITKETIEDNQYGNSLPREASNLAFSMQQAKEVNGANIFNRGFNASYTGGDGKALYSSSHPLGGGGTFSNTPSAAADLSETALEQACIDIGAWTDENGLQVKVRPRKLVIHRNDEFNVSRILNSSLQNDTANNAINALNSNGTFPEGSMINHYFTDGDAWFVITDIRGEDGLQHKRRWAPRFESDSEFDNNNARFKAYERYAFGWFNPRCTYGSAGA